ncbi:MAG: hypothetical protein GH155_04955 [Spirochaeta sp.]|nr:hypothetical protein [Spirochaeta sp.]
MEPLRKWYGPESERKPCNHRPAINLPFQSAAELHLLLPGTQLFLSLAAAGEFRSKDDFYLMTGGGLGLLF